MICFPYLYNASVIFVLGRHPTRHGLLHTSLPSIPPSLMPSTKQDLHPQGKGRKLNLRLSEANGRNSIGRKSPRRYGSPRWHVCKVWWTTRLRERLKVVGNENVGKRTKVPFISHVCIQPLLPKRLVDSSASGLKSHVTLT